MCDTSNVNDIDNFEVETSDIINHSPRTSTNIADNVNSNDNANVLKLNTSELVIGDYNTYKQLCNILKEPIKTGNAKSAQLKEWKRYFDYEKIGNKFLILDVYEEPLEKEYQYPANAVYIKYIETMLLSLLAATEGNMITITPQSLYQTFGMINNQFYAIGNLESPERLKELQKINSEMTEFEIDNFFERCKTKFSKVIKGAFTSLQRRMLIKYSEEYEYYVLEKKNLYDYRPNPQMEIHRYIANADDIEYILKVKRETMLKYGCEDESQIYLKRKTLPYYNEIHRRIKEERNWVGLYKVYVINYCRDTSIEALEKDQLTLQKYGLNEALIKYLDNQAKKNYEKTKTISRHSNKFRYPDNYIDMQLALSNKLLRLQKNEDIYNINEISACDEENIDWIDLI